VLLRRYRFHVRDADLVAPALLGGIESLVRALYQGGEQRRLRRGGHADADGQLHSAGERRRSDLGTDALGQRSRSLLGRLVKDDAELLATVARANV
jgi:hypothetical protein